MTEEIKIIKDFVEGRLPDSELELQLQTNTELKNILQDMSISWTGTYVKTNPLDFLKTLKLKSISGRLNAQGVLKSFLDKKGVTTIDFKKYSDDYKLILDTQPSYVDPDPDFVERVIIPLDKSKSETKKIMKEKFKELFQYHKRPPKWIQSANWPIKNDIPLFFLGQLEIKDCELFHDNGSIYLFMDKLTGDIETVKQFY